MNGGAECEAVQGLVLGSLRWAIHSEDLLRLVADNANRLKSSLLLDKGFVCPDFENFLAGTPPTHWHQSAGQRATRRDARSAGAGAGVGILAIVCTASTAGATISLLGNYETLASAVNIEFITSD